ncbi:hypothetical protein ACFS2C_21735 [Prauserella oleivorans]|uniref:Uncharacterized protein n=1 Tax=Prauserella oleivorans TaxID=1478153 RepID=A0ABW5WI13_9PSEU
MPAPEHPRPDDPPERPGHQPPFPRRRKPEGAAEQYPHETPTRYPGSGARIEGLPEPPRPAPEPPEE